MKEKGKNGEVSLYSSTRALWGSSVSSHKTVDKSLLAAPHANMGHGLDTETSSVEGCAFLCGGAGTD